MAWQIWLIVAGLCFVIELATVGFLVFWFGVGALITVVVSFFFPNNVVLQVAVFIISSTALLFATKPFVNKLSKKDSSHKTNAYSIIGKKGIVTQDINETVGIGQIKVAGEVWSAKTIDCTNLEKGTEIEVMKIDGVKAVVQKSGITSNIFSKW